METDFYVLETCINEITLKKEKNAAADFAAFLKESEMTFEKAGVYWENQNYFYVKYKGEFVCFLLVNGHGDEEKFYPFTVWTDDSSSAWYANEALSESFREEAVKHIDICENCGACSGGTTKKIFGHEYENVCRTTFRFVNPDFEQIKCLKELIILRKNYIDSK